MEGDGVMNGAGTGISSLSTPFNLFIFSYQLTLISPFFYFHSWKGILVIGSVSSLKAR
jgi:hypothetical protein